MLKLEFTDLIVHECMRVYYDRLIDLEEKENILQYINKYALIYLDKVMKN